MPFLFDQGSGDEYILEGILCFPHHCEKNAQHDQFTGQNCSFWLMVSKCFAHSHLDPCTWAEDHGGRNVWLSISFVTGRSREKVI